MSLRHNAHILLVEDNRMDVELTLDAFREVKFPSTIHVATTGQEAISYLEGRDAFADRTTYPLPDLILLDLKLPGLDGHQVLQRIKSMPHARRLPVVILTSSTEHSDRERSYDNGANSYLLKPLSFDELLDMVRQVESYWLRLNVPPPRAC
jgi:CheY-like chemotaxis protein